jgi:hypothetical protein
VVDKLKGLAIGAALGVARDAVTKSLPGNYAPQLGEAFDDMTKRLGGKPVGPGSGAGAGHPHEKGKGHAKRDATEMDRPVGAVRR